MFFSCCQQPLDCLEIRAICSRRLSQGHLRCLVTTSDRDSYSFEASFFFSLSLYLSLNLMLGAAKAGLGHDET